MNGINLIEVLAGLAKISESVPVLTKWAPAIDALVAILETQLVSQDDLIEVMKSAMKEASDRQMKDELGEDT